jgi:hypothetical protein
MATRPDDHQIHGTLGRLADNLRLRYANGDVHDHLSESLALKRCLEPAQALPNLIYLSDGLRDGIFHGFCDVHQD